MYYWECENSIRPPLIVIAGPTGVGKTAASVRLAKEINGEIVSADSMQIYKYMDIGTAKVTKEEMEGVPHHLIDILEPDEDYDVTRFKEMAKEAVSGILKRGRVPIVCGGTGFYIQALLYDIDFTEEGDREASERIRERYYKEAEELGRRAVHERLLKIDPLSYERIPANNLKRVVRALEFYELHGEPISAHNDREKEKRSRSPYDYRLFALTDDRQRLYDRIDRRVDLMMERGLLNEVRELRKMGIRRDATSMQAIGYRELLRYLDETEQGADTSAEEWRRAGTGLTEPKPMNISETKKLDTAAFCGTEPHGRAASEDSFRNSIVDGIVDEDELLKKAVDDIKKNSRHYAKRQLTWLRREPEVIEINISETGDIADEFKKHLYGNGGIPGGI